MLTKNQVEKIAEKYLIKNNFPILSPGKVKFAEDTNDLETKSFLIKEQLSVVSFKSKNFEDELDPGVYLVYVNVITGEVYMPRHM